MNVSNFFITSIVIAYALVPTLTVYSCKFKPLQRKAQYIFRTIWRPLDMSIVNDTFTVDTKRKCSTGCAERRSISLYYVKSAQTCLCNTALDSNTGSNPGATETSYGEAEYLQEDLEEGLMAYIWPPQRDCLEYYENGFRVDGTYTIQPVGAPPVNTWCDMTNGGWTVFQRRQDGSEDFFRNWDDYVAGFGDRCGEYWLGLDTIHLLTKEPSALYISMETFGDVLPTSGFASYSQFTIGDSSTKYNISSGGFKGNCYDGLAYQEGYGFTTTDNDNDGVYPENCANEFKGAWWYSHCHNSNLNGQYLKGYHAEWAVGVNWFGCWGYYYSLKETVMKVRRV